MTKVIPEHKLVTCDNCNQNANTPRRGILIIKQNGLDYQGCAVGDATRSFDLCDDCLDRVTKAIEHEMKKIRGLI